MNRLFTVEQVEAHNKRVREQTTNPIPICYPGALVPDLGASDDTKPLKNKTATGGAQKPKYEYEKWLENQLLAVGVTGMEREYLWARGRKYRADIAFPEKRLIVEINGAAHRIKGRFHDDILKHQEAILQGWVMLPVSTAQVRNGDACKLVKWVLGMLMAKGVPF